MDSTRSDRSHQADLLAAISRAAQALPDLVPAVTLAAPGPDSRAAPTARRGSLSDQTGVVWTPRQAIRLA